MEFDRYTLRQTGCGSLAYTERVMSSPNTGNYYGNNTQGFGNVLFNQKWTRFTNNIIYEYKE